MFNNTQGSKGPRYEPTKLTPKTRSNKYKDTQHSEFNEDLFVCQKSVSYILEGMTVLNQRPLRVSRLIS